MQTALAFIEAHAALILLLWPVATALITVLFGAADKYAESHPRLHAVLAFVESAGFDARGTIAALAKFLPKAPKGSGVALLLVGVGWGCLAVTNVRDTHPPHAPIAFELEACNNPPLVQDVTNAFTTISGCVISSIVTGGLSNPLQIAAQCGGIVIAQVIAIVENEIARQKADAGAVGASADIAKLETVLAQAKALQAKGAP